MIQLSVSSDHYTVSELTTLIKRDLESGFAGIRVEGEISNFRPSSTGHLYFTLKDANAVLSAVMFRSRAARLPFSPEDGQLVIASGNISVYEKRGNYQIICEKLEMAGEGNLLLLLEERKKKLAAEGLFDEDRKKPIPLTPSKIAVVTSPTGAALKDIMRVTRRRNAGVDIVVLPAPVQGDAAAQVIEAQIRAANRFHLGEVLIVGRGGGSLEDLLPFSDERVVRAVADSEIPVISAVGHEIDLALSDLAADVRAPTPSAAAEIVSANRSELLHRIERIRSNLESDIAQRTQRVRMLMDQFSTENLERNFRILIQPHLLRLDDAKEILVRALKDRVVTWKHRVELLEKGISAQSPLAILGKGYAVVTQRNSDNVISDSAQVEKGSEITIRINKGILGAEVTEVEK